MNQQSTGTPSPTDTITEREGVQITTWYREYASGVDPDPNYIRAFNIPMSDIQNLADFTKCTSVRAYLSLGTENVFSSLKIILVPVSDTNVDILSIPVTAPDGTVTEQSTIYDLTTPCPQMCDIDSPLFTGKM
ncbi:MAG: hypothetical protein U0X40_04660 [Ferruginibacter sp.]